MIHKEASYLLPVTEPEAWTLLPQPADLNKRLYFFVKRSLDIMGAGLALLVLFPLLVLIAAWIKLDSHGPVLFKQKRVGGQPTLRHGQLTWNMCPFTLYKFRSMYHDSSCELHQAFIEAFIDGDEERMKSLNGSTSAVRKLIADPRVTRAGHYLRRYSLDELPQFWNVLIGNMSLVGPRPALPYEVERYEPRHKVRLCAHPGLTGLWQVEARSSVDFEGMVRLDLWYIRHQSLWLDLKILFKTPAAICRGHGAC